MKILIACYSWKGHTWSVAHELEKKHNALYIDVVPQGGKSPVSGGMKALFGFRSLIKPAIIDLKNYGHLVIATPVWSHNLPPYSRQYLPGLKNGEGKQFSVLVEMGGSWAERVIGNVKKLLEAKKMEFFTNEVTLKKDVGTSQFDAIVTKFADKIRSKQEGC